MWEAGDSEKSVGSRKAGLRFRCSGVQVFRCSGVPGV